MNTALLATYGRTTVPMLFVGPVDSSAAEYQWLAANVPDASVIGQSIINHGGRFHDVLRVASPAGVRDYHFDVTPFMGLPTRAAGAVAPAGDAATELLTGVLGPLASSGQLDRVVDRLGNQLIDRLLAQPEVQRTIGDAIGKAAVKELAGGVGKPYVTTVTVAAGIGAASLLAIAVLYAARK
jgi:hypothetical protein